MSEKRVVVSKEIDTVVPRGGIKTKKPSVISMAIEHRFASRAYDLFEDRKAGTEKKTGLIALELVAVYEDGETEIIKIEGEI